MRHNLYESTLTGSQLVEYKRMSQEKSPKTPKNSLRVVAKERKLNLLSDINWSLLISAFHEVKINSFYLARGMRVEVTKTQQIFII